MTMDDIARLTAEDRRTYFEQAVAQWGRLTPQLMEKDFWVCWVLDRVFRIEELGEHLTFKGGTSLSKVYGAIERFSEDIDLSIERAYLGFGDDAEPERGGSNKEIQRRIGRLKRACQEIVAEQLVPALRTAIAESLASEEGWTLTLDSNDPDSQSILFQFPSAVSDRLSPYFAPTVKLELGARSDHFPVDQAAIRAYLYSALQEPLKPVDVTVRVLAGERTFWEKATILHATAHQPHEKNLPVRLSRHYYDLYQLANHAIGERALQQTDLLERVAVHKNVFFKSAWSRYDLAKPGTLKLVPDDSRIGELRIDYTGMQPMFFTSAPEFNEVIKRLEGLERQINHQPDTSGSAGRE
jgi:hypothetical protein